MAGHVRQHKVALLLRKMHDKGAGCAPAGQHLLAQEERLPK